MTAPVANGTVKGHTDRYWEDLQPGDRLLSPGLTVTETHLVNWAGLTGDVVSLHLDAQYAAKTRFGQRITHGPFTLSTALGLVTQAGYFGHVIAWLGLDNVRALKPVLIGDTIHAQATLTEAREAKDPAQGVWTFEYSVFNQHDDIVMKFNTSFLLERR